MPGTVGRVRVLGSAMAIAIGTAVPAWAHGTTERVSLGPGGVQGNGASVRPALSADGRFVAFDSARHQPGAGRHQRRVRRVRPRPPDGHDPAGEPRAGRRPGRWVQRRPGDLGGRTVRRLRLGCHQPGAGRHQRRARRVRPRPPDGHDPAREPGAGRRPGRCGSASTRRSRRTGGSSPSARTPPTWCRATPTAACDVFVRDRQTGTTRRVSLGPGGVQGNGFSGGPAISADGRFVAFDSAATNLVPGDTNGVGRRVRPRPPDGHDPAGEPRAGRRPGQWLPASARRSRRTGGSSPSPRRPPTWCRATPTARATCSSATARRARPGG